VARYTDPPKLIQGLHNLAGEGLLELLSESRPHVMDGPWLPWDKLRHRSRPSRWNEAQWWAGIKLNRTGLMRPLPLKDSDGRNFQFALPDSALQRIERINREASGQIAVPELVVNPGSRDGYLMRSLMEEAITSSQLEGAVTTRAVAKEMLRTGRAPRDESERMIVNNYRAMERIRSLRAEKIGSSAKAGALVS